SGKGGIRPAEGEKATEAKPDQKHDNIAISTLQVQVDDVKNVMTQNIEKVLKREERLFALADRSDDLETEKNTKMIIIIVAIILIVVTFIVFLATFKTI
uniref:V-SNARE coiled-coil homology domain-containing protein n=1 Tax=Anolis carolinensis TaxID=28377 RepID=A0A803T203_ANOCA